MGLCFDKDRDNVLTMSLVEEEANFCRLQGLICNWIDVLKPRIFCQPPYIIWERIAWFVPWC